MKRVQKMSPIRAMRVLLLSACLGLMGSVPWTSALGQDEPTAAVEETNASSAPSPTETVAPAEPTPTPTTETLADEAPPVGEEGQQPEESNEPLEIAPSTGDDTLPAENTPTETTAATESADATATNDAPQSEAGVDAEQSGDVVVDTEQTGDAGETVVSPDSSETTDTAVGETEVEQGEDANEAAASPDAVDTTDTAETEVATDTVQTGEVDEAAPETVLDLVETAPTDNVEIVSIESVELAPEVDAKIESLAASNDKLVVAAALVPVYDTPENAVAILVGEGISFSNVGYVGATVALGSFTGGTGIIGFENGVILSSGDIKSVVGPNTLDGKSTRNNTNGDADLSDLVDGVTHDAAVLTFDFVPQGNKVVFSYVFSSEEYNEYVNTQFNDVFAFYVNGVNCATVDGGRVSVNSINNGKPYGSDNASNPDLYINNDPSDGGGAINTEMDGLTVVLTCEATVEPGQSNTMKLAIADTSDFILDSNVFIQAKSFVVPTPTPKPGSTATPTPKPGSTATSTPKPGSTATSTPKSSSTAVPTQIPAPSATSETTGVTQLPNTGSGSQSSSMHWPLIALLFIGAVGLCSIARRGTVTR